MCIHSDSISPWLGICSLDTRLHPNHLTAWKQHCICTDSWYTLIDAGSCNPWPAAKTCASVSPICFSRHFHLSCPWLSNIWIGPPKLGGHVWSFKEKEYLPFDLLYILHLNCSVKTWDDNLCDSQLRTNRYNSQANLLMSNVVFGTWFYYGHFELRIQCWPLDWIECCLMHLAFTNHIHITQISWP